MKIEDAGPYEVIAGSYQQNRFDLFFTGRCKEIGDLLGLSALTVKSHLARIARKLGTGDRAEMVALAMRAGVIR